MVGNPIGEKREAHNRPLLGVIDSEGGILGGLICSCSKPILQIQQILLMVLVEPSNSGTALLSQTRLFRGEFEVLHRGYLWHQIIFSVHNVGGTNPTFVLATHRALPYLLCFLASAKV